MCRFTSNDLFLLYAYVRERTRCIFVKDFETFKRLYTVLSEGYGTMVIKCGEIRDKKTSDLCDIYYL